MDSEEYGHGRPARRSYRGPRTRVVKTTASAQILRGTRRRRHQGPTLSDILEAGQKRSRTLRLRAQLLAVASQEASIKAERTEMAARAAELDALEARLVEERKALAARLKRLEEGE